MGKFGFNVKVRHKSNGILTGRIESNPIVRAGQTFYEVCWDNIPGRQRIAEDDLERTDKAAPGMRYRDDGRPPISRTGLEAWKIRRTIEDSLRPPRNKEDRLERELKKNS